MTAKRRLPQSWVQFRELDFVRQKGTPPLCRKRNFFCLKNMEDLAEVNNISYDWHVFCLIVNPKNGKHCKGSSHIPVVFGSTLLDYRGDRKQPPEVTSADYKIPQNQVGNIPRIVKAALSQDVSWVYISRKSSWKYSWYVGNTLLCNISN